MTYQLLQADARALPFGEIVDLTVTSPPYGAGIEYDEGGDVAADGWPTFMAAWLAEAYRVTKPSGRLALNVPLDMSIGAPRLGRAMLSRPTYYQAVHAAQAAGWLYKGTIFWDKNNHKKGNRGLGSVNSSARPYVVDPTETVDPLHEGRVGAILGPPRRHPAGRVAGVQPWPLAVPRPAASQGRAPGPVPGGAAASLHPAALAGRRRGAGPVRR